MRIHDVVLDPLDFKPVVYLRSISRRSISVSIDIQTLRSGDSINKWVKRTAWRASGIDKITHSSERAPAPQSALWRRLRRLFDQSIDSIPLNPDTAVETRRHLAQRIRS